MWIFTQRGFVSVVEYDPKQDKHKGSPFAGLTQRRGSHVLVRSRVRQDLEDLRRVVKNMRIYDDPSADYKYRAVIKRKDFNKWLLLSSDEIDYDSHFKEAAQANSRGATGRYSAYMSVWSAMMRLQTAPQYNPSKNPKPLIGPGAQYENVDDYLTRSGFKAKQAKKPVQTALPIANNAARGGWDDDWSYYPPLTAVKDPEPEPEVFGGDLTLNDLRELLEETALTDVSAAVVNELNDEAFEVWCRLDEQATQGDIDPLRVLDEQVINDAVEYVKSYDESVDTGNMTE